MRPGQSGAEETVAVRPQVVDEPARHLAQFVQGVKRREYVVEVGRQVHPLDQLRRVVRPFDEAKSLLRREVCESTRKEPDDRGRRDGPR